MSAGLRKQRLLGGAKWVGKTRVLFPRTRANSTQLEATWKRAVLPITQQAYEAHAGAVARVTASLSSAFPITHLAETVLYLSMDGSSGSTSFTDSSNYGHAVTAGGSASISTASPKYGTGTTAFDSATLDYLKVPMTSALQLGNSDFTIEGYIDVTNTGTTINNIAGSWGAQPGFLVFVNNGGTLGFDLVEQGGTALGFEALSAAGAVPLNTGTYQHFAVVRLGNVVTIYINGTASGTPVTITSGYTMPAMTAPIFIGAQSYADTDPTVGDSDFRLDEFGITKFARYQTNFTPGPFGTDAIPSTIAASAAASATATATLTVVAGGTVLATSAVAVATVTAGLFSGPSKTLAATPAAAASITAALVSGPATPQPDPNYNLTVFHLRAGDQYAPNQNWPVVDVGPGHRQVTYVGTMPAVEQGAGPIYHGDISFDASGGLNLPWTDDCNIGSSDFTLQFWLYTPGFSGGPSSNLLVAGYNGSDYAFNFMVLDGGVLYLGVSAQSISIDGLAASTWHHIALVRSGTSLKGYANGINFAAWSTTLSGGLTFNSGTQLNIGHVSGSPQFQGKIYDLKFQKLAQYTSNFSRPTQPLLSTDGYGMPAPVTVSSVTAAGSATATAALTTAIGNPVAANATAAAAASGTLSTSSGQVLAANAVAVAAVTGAIDTSVKQLATQAQAVASVGASFKLDISLSSQVAQVVSGVTAGLGKGIGLASTPQAVATLGNNLYHDLQMAASAQAVATAAPVQPVYQVLMVANAVAVATSSGLVAKSANMSVAATGAANATAALGVGVQLASAPVAQASASALLTVGNTSIAAASSAAASMTAALSTGYTLGASAQASASKSAALFIGKALATAAYAQASVAATYSISKLMAAVVSAQANASATAVIPSLGPVQPDPNRTYMVSVDGRTFAVSATMTPAVLADVRTALIGADNRTLKLGVDMRRYAVPSTGADAPTSVLILVTS